VPTARAEHLRSLAIARVDRIVDRLESVVMDCVDVAIRVHLSLDRQRSAGDADAARRGHNAFARWLASAVGLA
jgi:hypothetical protein